MNNSLMFLFFCLWTVYCGMVWLCTIFTYVWINKKCPQCCQVTILLSWIWKLLEYCYTQTCIVVFCFLSYVISELFCLLIECIYLSLSHMPNLPKPRRPLSPVVKSNKLIPPNVSTSLSSFMSHNIESQF